jgi:hypothetical protein
MTARKNPHAVALGRRGGSVSSAAKTEAARANGKRGGRPRTRPVLAASVIKSTRVETNETAAGALRERTVTTWFVVETGGSMLSEHATKRDAVAARAELIGGSHAG